MKHRAGNTPKCNECFWYHEKEGNCIYDGWCTNPYQLSHGINGRLREKPIARIAVRWMWVCRFWKDAEDGTTFYEIVTGTKGDERK